MDCGNQLLPNVVKPLVPSLVGVCLESIVLPADVNKPKMPVSHEKGDVGLGLEVEVDAPSWDKLCADLPLRVGNQSVGKIKMSLWTAMTFVGIGHIVVLFN